MAKKTKKTRTSKTTSEEQKVQADVINTKETETTTTKMTKIKKTPALTPASKASAEIIEKAVEATKQKVIPVQKPIVLSIKKEVIPAETKTTTTQVAPKVEEETKKETKPVVSMYDLYLGRYCKIVSDHRNGETTKRPISAFINLMEFVIRSSSAAIFNDMLKFFTLEAQGLMANTNALNGIETINDPVVKNKVMTAFTVFHGLAVQRATGRRPSFSVNAIRAILKNDKFTNWVNMTLN